MALTGINPTRKIIQRGSNNKPGGANALSALGTVAGGIAGAFSGTPQGVAAGAAAGGAAGGIIGGALDPAKAGQQQIEDFKPQVQLTASEESIRGQQLMASLQAANRTPGFGQFTAPLTKAYVQSMINLKNMG